MPREMSRVQVDRKRRTSRILWGRIAVLLLLAVTIFVLGRCSATDDAVRTELEQAERRVGELEQENRNLQEQLRAQEAGGIEEAPADPAAAPPPEDPEEPAAEQAAAAEEPPAPDQPAGEGTTYVVRPGDTLQRIAQQVYGDGRRFPLIAQANGIEPRHLTPGQELRIPPDPGQG